MSWRAVPPAPDGVQRRTSGRLHASLVRKGLLKTSSAAAYYVASLHSDEQNRMRGRFDAAAAEAAAMRSVKKRWRMYDRLLGYMGISTDMRIGVEMGSLDFIQVGDYRRGAVVVERYRWYPFDGEWQRKQLSEDEVVKQVLSDACSDLVEESYRTVPFFDKQCMADYDFKRLRCRELSFRASGFKDPREESTVLVNVEPKPLREDARCAGNTNADVIVKEMPRRTWFLQPPQLYDCGTCCGNQVDDAEHFPVQSRPEPDSTSEPAVEVPVEELPIPEHISIVPVPAKAFGPSNVPASLEYRVDAVPHEAIASHWLCEDSAGWCRRVQQKRQTTLYTPTE